MEIGSNCHLLAFTKLSDQGALDKGPMYFRLLRVDMDVSSGSDATGKQEPGTTHSGVLEFTAREGCVELPPHVWSNLLSSDVVEVPLVEVCYISLPKGTYAKLKPEGMGFSDIPNHQAVLETTLRKHAGDIIMVNYGELSYKLRVLELKPATSVSVLETEIEVDIEGSASVSDSNKSQHMLIPLILGKSELGTVDEGMFNYYKFSIEDSISEKIASGSMNIEVKLEAVTTDGDTDIYVSRHPLVFPTQHRHEWSSHDVGSKVLILDQKDSALLAGTYSVGVFGFKGLTRYLITVALKDNDNITQRVGDNAKTLSLVPDTVECQNCKHFISKPSITIHEAYCIRHNVLCQHDGCGVVLRKEDVGNHAHCSKCGKAFQLGEIEKHMKVFREPLHCPCGVAFEKEEMVQHQSTTCPLRLIVSRFCGDMVQAGSTPLDARDRLNGLSEHESICGSRTAPCDSCSRCVMLKEMDIHFIAVHQKKLRCKRLIVLEVLTWEVIMGFLTALATWVTSLSCFRVPSFVSVWYCDVFSADIRFLGSPTVPV